jgi:hypothetical protein
MQIKQDGLPVRQCQKRPTTVSKETYYSVKRDLLQCQKRPTTVSKMVYLYASQGDLVRLAQREASHARAAAGDGSQPPISDAAARLRMPAREVEGLEIREEVLYQAHAGTN